MTGNQNDDPAFDADGLDLSVCRGLAERLEKIDTAFWSLPPNQRTVDAMRLSAIESLRVIRDASVGVVACRFGILEQIIEGLTIARDGRAHPLTAVICGADAEPKARLTIAAIQAEAAAVLEYGFTDHRKQQAEWSNQIAAKLGEYGLRKSGAPYTGSAVVDWRKKCIAGTHQEASRYIESLTFFRGCAGSPEGALNFIAWHCDQTLVGTHGKKHPGFSNRPQQTSSHDQFDARQSNAGILRSARARSQS